jgi:hypothetical protein
LGASLGPPPPPPLSRFLSSDIFWGCWFNLAFLRWFRQLAAFLASKKQSEHLATATNVLPVFDRLMEPIIDSTIGIDKDMCELAGDIGMVFALRWFTVSVFLQGWIFLKALWWAYCYVTFVTVGRGQGQCEWWVNHGYWQCWLKESSCSNRVC